MIAHPDNSTVCNGGTAIFTCIIDILNVSINTRDIKWQRIREDHNTTVMISHGVRRFNVVNNISEGTLTSVVMITNVRSTDMGPYWLELKITNESMTSDTGFLNVPNGMYVRRVYPFTGLDWTTGLSFLFLCTFKRLS